MSNQDDPRQYGDPADDGYGGGYEAAYDQDEGDPPRRRALTSAVIVAVGLSVFAGIIWYAYSQGTRAGTETMAPILRAETTPTKVKPETPGGLQVPHQDKLVYGRLNPGQTSEPGVERLLPPPEVPLERPKPPEPVAPAPAERTVTESPPTAPVDAPAASAPGAAPRDLLAAPEAAPVQTAQTPTPAAPAKPEPAKPEPAKPEPVKPEPPKAEAAKPEPAPPSQTAQVPAAGGVRLQIAAVDSESKAIAEWARLQRRFPELGGLGVRYVRADLGARGVFYRIQAGPVDEARAREVCAALKAQNVGCLTVRN